MDTGIFRFWEKNQCRNLCRAISWLPIWTGPSLWLPKFILTLVGQSIPEVFGLQSLRNIWTGSAPNPSCHPHWVGYSHASPPEWPWKYSQETWIMQLKQPFIAFGVIARVACVCCSWQICLVVFHGLCPCMLIKSLDAMLWTSWSKLQDTLELLSWDYTLLMLRLELPTRFWCRAE